MRKYLVAKAAVLFVTGLFAGGVLAADGAANKPAKAGLGGIAERLKLTDDQKAKAKEILDAAKAEVQKADSLQAVVKVLKDALEKIRTDVLTDEQRTALGDLKGKLAAGVKGLGKAALEKLKLTDDQKAKVKEIMEAAKAEAQKAEGREGKMKALKDAFEKIKGEVLTDDQRKQLEDMKGKVGALREKIQERIKERREGAATGDK